MADMRYNSGPAFVHPVTHRKVEPDSWYEGAAHFEGEQEIEQETEASVVDDLTEGSDGASADVFTCPKCGKEYKTQKNFEAHVEKCEAEGKQPAVAE